ncbi:DUF4817 domain-containing protein [Trichonephila clavata]|uniref:DUF4817 domain-containing protein n=1 Tax=Trichonephila clavata TaxID=2740835 RepID=A0A8X6I3D9_TRICU|nr:DUF4817 domain-containing protein [Trichonephila clavata]
MMNRIGVDSNFLEHVIFSDESCFHTCGKVNKHNCHSLGNENPHQLCEYESVWLGMHTNDIIGPFFFVEKAVKGHVYLHEKLCCSTNFTRFSVLTRWRSTTQPR